LYLRPEIKSTATVFMPEVASDLSYDFNKVLESFLKELGWAS
jgi:hypothetical protein